HLFKHYGNVFFLSLALIIVYILSLYFIATRFNVSATIKAIKRMIPAGLTGFSTMSSAATLPVTLQCTEENTKNRNFTDLIIPATSNIHMLG
ncbi:cation:dicarboxylase symporter family transporter, partial [Acinetobacter baumannii]